MSEETEPEKTNSKPERSSQEASLMYARKLLREGILPIEDISAKTGLSVMAVRGLKGAQARAQKKLVEAQTHSMSTQAVSKPQFQIQAEDEPIDLSEGAGSHTPSLNLTSANQAQAETLGTIGGEGVSHPSPSPSNFVLRAAMTREEWTKYSKMKTADLVSEIADLKAQNASLQGVGQTGRGNGEGHSNNGFGGENYIDALGRLVDKLSMQKQAEKVVDRMFPSEKDDSELSRRLDRIETKLDSAKQGSELLQVAKALTELARPNQPGRDPAADILLGNQMRESIEKNVQSQYSVGVAKSEIDLKLQEMQQSERLDYKKLDFDVMKWQRQEQKGDTYVELLKDGIKTISSGPIGKMIENYGGAKAEQVRNQGARIKTVDVVCPRCTNKFRANPDLQTLFCPTCGAGLTKQEPQPQAEPQPSEAQPEPTETEPEPKGPSTEDKGTDVTTDALEVKHA